MASIERIEAEVSIALAPEYIARLIAENDAMKEREQDYIRHSQNQERCTASLRRRLSELEDQIRQAAHVRS